jgi:hypothetical protein
MMKRLAFCAMAALLAWGAVSGRPAAACAYTCDTFECDRACVQRGYLGGFCRINLCHSSCICYN